jgi:hypothetical protein
MRPILLALLLVVIPATAPAAGGLDAGGGERAGDAIHVQDTFGLPFAGTSSGAGIVVQSGLLYGLGTPTPVLLASLQLTVEADGVAIAWQAPADQGVAFFRVERARVAGGAATDYVQVGPDFEGSGPHRYLDRDVQSGATYRYRLGARLRNGGTEILGPWTVTLDRTALPTTPRVLPISPNPFRDAFVLTFALPAETPVRWRLFDIRGAEVAEGDLGRAAAGTHAVAVTPPAATARGIYFLEVRAGEDRDVQKVVRLP